MTLLLKIPPVFVGLNPFSEITQRSGKGSDVLHVRYVQGGMANSEITAGGPNPRYATGFAILIGTSNYKHSVCIFLNL